MNIHVIAKSAKQNPITEWDVRIVGSNEGEPLATIRKTDEGIFILEGFAEVKVGNSLNEVRDEAQFILDKMSVLIN
jgi:hypothetical protein